jgi:hypothetical protein
MTVTVVAICLLFLVSASHQSCIPQWNETSQVSILRNSKFEVLVSAASARIFGVRPSGTVYRDEFVELSLVCINFNISESQY